MPSKMSGLALLCLLSMLAIGHGMFEDEFGQKEWMKVNIGRTLNNAVLFQGKRIIAATESNVLASINARTGVIQWRHSFSSPASTPSSLLSTRKAVFSLSGDGSLVSKWQISTGNLIWDLPTGATDPSASAMLVEQESALVVLAGGTIAKISSASGRISWTATQPSTVRWETLFLLGQSAIVLGRDGSQFVAHSLSLQTGKVEELGRVSGAPQESTQVTFLSASPTTVVAAFLTPSATTTTIVPVLAIADGAAASAASAATSPAITVATPAASAVSALRCSGAPTHALPSLLLLSTPAAAAAGTTTVLSLSTSPLAAKPVSGNGVPACAALGTTAAIAFASTAAAAADDASATEAAAVSVRMRASPGASPAVADHSYPSLPTADHGAPSHATLTLFRRRDGSGSGWRLLLRGGDHSLSLVQGSVVHWTREEGLASVTHAEFVEMPRLKGAVVAAAAAATAAAAAAATGGDGSSSGGSGAAAALSLSPTARWEHQLRTVVAAAAGVGPQLTAAASMIAHAVVGGKPPSATAGDPRLRRLLLLLSAAGKLYALDSTDGALLWSRLLPPGCAHRLVLTRSAAVGGQGPPQALVLSTPSAASASASGSTSASGAISALWLNAVTGQPLAPPSALPSSLRTTYAVATDSPSRRALVLLANAGCTRVRLLAAPGSPLPLPRAATTVHLHNVRVSQGIAHGFSVQLPAAGAAASASLPALPLWSLSFPGERIVAHSAAPPPLASRAHILGDDSLLLKYLNPHLIAIASATNPPTADTATAAAATAADTATNGGGVKAQSTLTMSLVDGVSGAVLYRSRHRGADGRGVEIMQSEHWVVYTYWSVRGRRTEVEAVTLFEDRVERLELNPMQGHAFSSLTSAFTAAPPIVLHRNYVLPGAATALAASRTRHGITATHLLAATQAGQVVSLNLELLEPRRPASDPTPGEQREGLLKYSPYLPHLPLAVVSRNRSVTGVTNLFSCGVALESTSLLLATGRDVFFTPITPSNTFDQMAPTFNYGLLVVLLSAVAIATVVASAAVRRSRLQSQWL